MSIGDVVGNHLEDPQAVKREILKFYMQMLGTTFDEKRPSHVQLGFANTVPVSHHATRTSPVTPKEIKLLCLLLMKISLQVHMDTMLASFRRIGQWLAKR